MKMISVWSPCGGSGRTTLALLLADSLKSKGFNVALVDLASNEDALAIANFGKLPFSVVDGGDMDEATNKKLITMDYIIMDYDIDADVDENSDVIVMPLRPAVLHMKKLSESLADLPDIPKLPVFNFVETNREEHLNFLKNKAGWPILKNRSIYERMIEKSCTVYGKEASGWASLKPAVSDVDLLTDLVLHQLEGTIPSSKERCNKMMAKLGSAE